MTHPSTMMQPTSPTSPGGGRESIGHESIGYESTVATVLTVSGVGLHLGSPCQVQIHPAPVHTGRVFRRIDLPDRPSIPAQIDQVRQTTLSTELATATASVRTVEHLLAALWGLGVDNAFIDIDGPEVPLLDGSAAPWVMAIAQAGIQIQDAPRAAPILAEPLWVHHGDAFVAALPSPTLRFTYGIDFEVPAIGNQWVSWSPSSPPSVGASDMAVPLAPALESDPESFDRAIAPARTFGLAHQIEHLRSLGLIQGGTLDNALVCGAEGWLNPPLRFSNEPVRHKLLDLIGDLSLVGVLPRAHYLAYKASHQLHTQLASQLQPLTAAFFPVSHPDA